MSGRTAGAGLATAALGVAVVTVAARVVGFGRWLVFSGSVGSTCVGEAYATANLLPNVIFEVAAGGALAGAVVPLLAGPLGRGALGRADADRIASALLGWALLVLVPMALLLAALAGPLADLLVGGPGCDGQAELAVRLLLVFAPQVVLYGVGVVLAGVLQAHHRFLWPALGPLVSSMVVIVAYLLFAAAAGGAQDDPAHLPAAAAAALAWGTTAGVAAMTLPLLLPVARTGTRLRPTLRFPEGVAPRARSLAVAGVLALLAQQLAVLAALVLANAYGRTGTLNVFQYAQAVYLLPYAVLAVPLATVAFPRLAAYAAAGDPTAFAATAAWTTRAVTGVSLLGAAVLAGAAPAVAAFFVAIDAGTVTGMAPALTAMAPGIVGLGLLAHVGRALYALERGRLAATATSAGWLAVVAASAVGVLLSPGPDQVVVALAAGSTVGMSVGGAGLLWGLRRAAGPDAARGLGRTLAAGTTGAVLAAASARLLADACLAAWGAGPLACAAAGAAAGAAAVLVLAAVVLVGDRSTAQAVAGLLRRRPLPAGTGG